VSERERHQAVYDRVFSHGGYGGVYDLHYRHSCYYPLFRRVLRELRQRGSRRLLEVGCATGAFAHLLFERTDLDYRGFDLSPVAIERAINRTGRTGRFFVADATESSSYAGVYDSMVCTEVLEHIPNDLDVIKQWKAGAFCVCSVPNFDADTHERFFGREAEVRARYGNLLDITRIVRLRKPALSDISLANYLRAVRWNRYRPRRLAELLGLATFDAAGGWFVFVGTKR